MGLIVPPTYGPVIDGAPGASAGRASSSHNDPFFNHVSEELADKGFLVTNANHVINWARTGSLMWMTFGLACCAVEMIQAAMPRYDL